MKVILLADVPKIGRRFEIKEVANGYAMNALLPKGLAKLATPDAVKAVEADRKRNEAEAALKDELLVKTLESVNGKTVTLKEKVNDQGHLFHGLHEKDVLEAIEKELGVTLNPHVLTLSEPIKEAGEHELTLSHGGSKVKVMLVIEK